MDEEDVLKSQEEQEKSQKLPTSAHPRPRGIVGDRAAEGVALIRRHRSDEQERLEGKELFSGTYILASKYGSLLLATIYGAPPRQAGQPTLFELTLVSFP